MHLTAPDTKRWPLSNYTPCEYSEQLTVNQLPNPSFTYTTTQILNSEYPQYLHPVKQYPPSVTKTIFVIIFRPTKHIKSNSPYVKTSSCIPFRFLTYHHLRGPQKAFNSVTKTVYSSQENKHKVANQCWELTYQPCENFEIIRVITCWNHIH